MYIRYTQPPGDLYDWYEEYLQDEEEVDAKAGGGSVSILLLIINMIICIIKIHFLAKYDYWTNAASMANQTGLVFNIISTYSGAHPKTN